MQAGIITGEGILHLRSDKSVKNVVLGKNILEEVWKDQKQIELPSFESCAPLLGAVKQTPTTDHW